MCGRLGIAINRRGRPWKHPVSTCLVFNFVSPLSRIFELVWRGPLRVRMASTMPSATVTNSCKIGIIGAGPAGFYCAKYLDRLFWNVPLQIVLMDKSPFPFGLLRYGVSLDHPEVRNSAREFNIWLPAEVRLGDPEETFYSVQDDVGCTDDSTPAEMIQVFANPPSITERDPLRLESLFQNGKQRIQFVGNLHVGADFSLQDVTKAGFNIIVLAVGAEEPRRLNLPGAPLRGVLGSSDFIRWCNKYCCHQGPYRERSTFRRLLLSQLNVIDPQTQSPRSDWPLRRPHRVIIIGLGNVAIDTARILLKDMTQYPMSSHARKLISSHIDVESVEMIGRRGLLVAAFTTSELRELSNTPGILVAVNPLELEHEKISLASSDPDFLKTRKASRMLSLLESLSANWSKAVVLREMHSKIVEGAEARNQGLETPVFLLGNRVPEMYVGGSRGNVEAVVFRRARPLHDTESTTETRTAAIVFESLGFGQPPMAQDQLFRKVTLNDDAPQKPKNHTISYIRGTNCPIYSVGWCNRGATGALAATITDAVGTARIIRMDFESGLWN